MINKLKVNTIGGSYLENIDQLVTCSKDIWSTLMNALHFACEKLINNVSEWSNELLFQSASTIKIQLSMLVLYKADIIIISSKFSLFSPLCSWKKLLIWH
jgi:hypothetical protein